MMLKRLFAAVVFCAFALPAQAARVQEVVSDKGFKAWLVEEHSTPLFSVRVAFKGAGFAYDPDGKEGRASMTAALLLEGAGDLDSKAFNAALESLAIRANSSVDEDLFYVSMESLSEHRDKAFYYLGQMLTQPRIDSGAVDRVKTQAQSIIKQQDEQPGYQLQKAWRLMAFGAHPYSKPLTGTAESVRDLSGSDASDVVKRYLTKENMLIAVVGDITPGDLKTLLDTHFANLPANYKPDSKVDDITLPTGKSPKLIEFNIPQTMVAFGLQGLKRSDPDYFAAYVMNQLLGGGGALNSRLGKEIRGKRGLSYGVYSRLLPFSHAAIWDGTFATRNDQAAQAIDVLYDTIADFAENGPTDAELQDAKQFIKGSFVLKLDSNDDVADFLINMQFNQLGMDYLDKRNSLVEAVRKEDVMAMARKLLDVENMLVVMVGKPELKPSAAPAATQETPEAPAP